MYDFLIGPFAEFAFMRRALLGACILSLSACPVGVFLMLRRMSLTGDAMAHAILPGAALGFLISGLALVPMTVGGLAAGLLVALAAGAVSRLTVQREDASLAAFYLISLALGVLLVSLKGSSVDLMHVLFGTVLALNNEALRNRDTHNHRAGSVMATPVCRMHGSPVSPLCQQVRFNCALRISGSGRPQSGRRISGTRHPPRSWPDDAPGSSGAILVSRS
jgi:ABC 3 transport family